MAPEIKPSSPVPPALKKIMGASLSLFRSGFNSSKCKTEAKMATARIKLLRNKREAQVRQMRRDVAQLLGSGRDDTARIRIEHVIREQNILAANEIIEVFCELVVTRLPVISKLRDCPADLKESISSLIYAAPRCSEIPELNRICRIFEKKYGKDFVSAATDLRPDSGVNRMLIEKLSVRKPTGELKLKILKEIAKEYHVQWDTTESEQELLKPPEEVLQGPCSFVSASSFPVKPNLPQQPMQQRDTNFRSGNSIEGRPLQFKDTVSAAQAAAESAEMAISAAQAAAYLANQNSHPFDQTAKLNTVAYNPNISNGPERLQGKSLSSGQAFDKNDAYFNGVKTPGKFFNSQSFNESNYWVDEDMDTAKLDSKKTLRRSSTARAVHSDIKFDDSDGFSESEKEELTMEPPPRGSCPPPNRPPPVPPSRGDHVEQISGDDTSPKALKQNLGSHVHPKLPDYDVLTARFEALKSHRF